MDCPLQDNGNYFQDLDKGALILKFDEDGNRLWATNYGANTGISKPYDVACAPNGNVYITGQTGESDFPTLDAGGYYNEFVWFQDAFILEFDNDGNRLWATSYGGSGIDFGASITVNPFGEVFVLGHSTTYDFPVLDAGTYFEDAGIGGDNQLFILKFDSLENRLWATCYGGNLEEQAVSIGSDSLGNIVVLGTTSSHNFPTLDAGTYYQPTKGGYTDMGIVRFDRHGNRLWATYYGGNLQESVYSHDNLEIDRCGNIYIGFETESTIMPMTTDCYGSSDETHSLNQDLFAAKFSATGNFLWSSYNGGEANDFRSVIAIDESANLYQSGERVNAGGLVASYTLTDPGDGHYFDGTPNGSDDLSISKFGYPSLTGTFEVVSDTCNSCVGSITFLLSDDSDCEKTFTWSNGETTTTTENTITITEVCTGYHSLLVTSDCGVLFQDSVFLPTHDPLVELLDLGPDTIICDMNNFLIDPDLDLLDAVYTWQDDSHEDSYAISESGTYWVEVESGGCISVDTIFVNLVNLDVDLGPDTTICYNELYTLDAGNPGATYNWHDASTAQLFPIVASGYHWVNVMLDGCEETDSIHIQLFERTPISFGKAKDDTLCIQNGSVWIFCSPDGGVLTGPGVDGFEFFPDIAGIGVHYVTYTFEDDNGCFNSDSLQFSVVDCLGLSNENQNKITIYPNPFSDFTTINFGPALTEKHTIIINDILGREVYRKENITSATLEIKKEALGVGVHILSLLNSDSETVFVTKLVVE